MNVTKRDGSLEKLQIEKIQQCIQWASLGLDNVSESQIELDSAVQFYEGITTDEIHETMIKSAADLITAKTPDYSKLAARLRVFQLRKRAYTTFTPPTLHSIVKKLVALGKYDKSLLEFTDAEFEVLESVIDHSRDLDLHYAGIEQYNDKYLVQDRVEGIVYETPQVVDMCVAMCLFQSEEDRMEYIINYYNYTSKHFWSNPTPIKGGVRTPTRQFSSCTLIDVGDSLDSICAASNAIVKYISLRAGVGINGGRIRALGSKIRDGEAFHTGVIPFWKHFQTAVKSCSQGGMRGGSATLFYPIWHLEVESLLVLKNNRGIEENRIRHIDYGVQINGYLYARLIEDGNITLFSPDAVPGMYEAFFNNQGLFARLYEEAEKDPNIPKKSIYALDLFISAASERAGVGRIYIMNADHCNTHSSFIEEIAPIVQSNLCVEITLPTRPLDNILDTKGEIALCTLGAVNLGLIDKLSDLKPLIRLAVRALDNLLDYQDYPIEAARLATMNRRPLGIGITNYAYYLAKNGLKYSDPEALTLLHRTMEAFQYYLIEASMELAKERGPCPKFNETKYSKGIMPIHTYKLDVDSIPGLDSTLQLDWVYLAEQVMKHGLRNSTLSAFMPCESSSQVSNSTSGMDAPRGPVTVKESKSGLFNQVVPEIGKVVYEYLWDIINPRVMINHTAIITKFADQSVSANVSYDPDNFPKGKVEVKKVLADMLYAYKVGVKTLYYHNTRDGSNDDEEIKMDNPMCIGDGCDS